MIRKSVPSRHVVITMNVILDNAIDPGNHHTKFEICLTDLYSYIVEVSNFP